MYNIWHNLKNYLVQFSLFSSLISGGEKMKMCLYMCRLFSRFSSIWLIWDRKFPKQKCCYPIRTKFVLFCPFVRKGPSSYYLVQFSLFSSLMSGGEKMEMCLHVCRLFSRLSSIWLIFDLIVQLPSQGYPIGAKSVFFSLRP